MKIKCKICSNQFTRTPAQVRMGSGKYCSRVCYGGDLSHKRKGENNPNWKNAKKTLTCANCKKEFTTYDSKKYLCSLQCAGKRTSARQSGSGNSQFGKLQSLEARKKNSLSHPPEKSPLWRGGVAKLHKTQRQSLMDTPEYRFWRKSVFIRDNFTCQICWKRGGQLNANHIKKWSTAPALRFTINNGITLCQECHFSLVNHHEEKWEAYFNLNLTGRRVPTGALVK